MRSRVAWRTSCSRAFRRCGTTSRRCAVRPAAKTSSTGRRPATSSSSGPSRSGAGSDGAGRGHDPASIGGRGHGRGPGGPPRNGATVGRSGRRAPAGRGPVVWRGRPAPVPRRIGPLGARIVVPAAAMARRRTGLVRMCTAVGSLGRPSVGGPALERRSPGFPGLTAPRTAAGPGGSRSGRSPWGPFRRRPVAWRAATGPVGDAPVGRASGRPRVGRSGALGPRAGRARSVRATALGPRSARRRVAWPRPAGRAMRPRAARPTIGPAGSCAAAALVALGPGTISHGPPPRRRPGAPCDANAGRHACPRR